MFARKSSTARFFDRWAPGYDRSLEGFLYGVPARLFAATWPYLEKKTAPVRILDLGIGTGLCSIPFRETGKTYITGVDASEKMLALCRARAVADETICLDILRDPLPFPAESFDAVIAGGLLEFIPNLRLLCDEMARVMKPGGILALTYETPATKHLYPTGFLDGILEDEEDRVVVSRSFPGLLLPRVYKKYLHAERAMEESCLDADIYKLSTDHFVAYQWSAEQPVSYAMFLGQKRRFF